MSADHVRLSEDELASCASVFAGYEPTGDVDGHICAACNASVDVHDDHEWTDGDICDSCAAAECANMMKAGRKLLTELVALRAELDAALIDAEKWREQERLQEQRDDAAERGGDW
jgi:hypothetical protein